MIHHYRPAQNVDMPAGSWGKGLLYYRHPNYGSFTAQAISENFKDKMIPKDKTDNC